ncbi:MAG: L-glutamate gamma-semialdehyde dehydrogenase, partial [FCB group bacterium]|nr:L-glutamate gamma-semialdehyde dehydrogenase [FCB group bacterium]
MVEPYKTTPMTDFSNPKNREAMEKAIAKVKSELGREYPIVIGGEEIFSGETFKTIHPAGPPESGGVFAQGTQKPGLQTIAGGNEKFRGWEQVPADHRGRSPLQAAKSSE